MEVKLNFDWVEYVKGIYSSVLFALASADITSARESRTYVMHNSSACSAVKNRNIRELERIDGLFGQIPNMETDPKYLKYSTTQAGIINIIDNVRIITSIAKGLHNYDWRLNASKPINFSAIMDFIPEDLKKNPNRTVATLSSLGIEVDFDFDASFEVAGHKIPDNAVINNPNSLSKLRDMVKFCLEHLPKENHRFH